MWRNSKAFPDAFFDWAKLCEATNIIKRPERQFALPKPLVNKDFIVMNALLVLTVKYYNNGSICKSADAVAPSLRYLVLYPEGVSPVLMKNKRLK